MTDHDVSTSPIVLLHGAMSSARVWDLVLPALEVKRRVLAPTLAGHRGGPPLSVAPAAVVEGIVDSMCRQLDEAGIDTPHLVGNSLGGWVALELARRGRARSVLALSPAGAWRSPRDLTRLLSLFRVGAALTRRKGLPKLANSKHARRVLLRAMAEHADRLTPAQVAALFEDGVGCAVLTDLVTGAREAGAMDPFTRLACPVRIVWAGCDRTLPFMRYGAPMLAAVPGAEFAILPDVGHVPMIDDPGMTAATILAFIDTVEARATLTSQTPTD